MRTTALVLATLLAVSFALPVPFEPEHRDRRSVKKTASLIEEELENVENQIDDIKTEVGIIVQESEHGLWSKEGITRPEKVKDALEGTLAEFFHDKSFDEASLNILTEGLASQMKLSSLEKEELKAQLRTRLKVEEAIPSGVLRDLVDKIVKDIRLHDLKGEEVESFIKLMVEQAGLSEHWELEEQLRMLKRVRGAVHHALYPEAYKLNSLSRLEVLALDGILEKKTEKEGLTLEERFLVMTILHHALGVSSTQKPTETLPSTVSSTLDVVVEKKDPVQQVPLSEEEAFQEEFNENEDMAAVNIESPQEETAEEDAESLDDESEDLQGALQFEDTENDALTEQEEEALEDAFVQDTDQEASVDETDKTTKDESEVVVSVEKVVNGKESAAVDEEESFQTELEKLQENQIDASMEEEEADLESDPFLVNPRNIRSGEASETDGESVVQVDGVEAVEQPNDKSKVEVSVEKSPSVTGASAEEEEILQAAVDDTSIENDNPSTEEEEASEKFQNIRVEKLSPQKEPTAQVERIDNKEEEEDLETAVEKLQGGLENSPAEEGIGAQENGQAERFETVSVEKVSPAEELSAAQVEKIDDNEEEDLEAAVENLQGGEDDSSMREENDASKRDNSKLSNVQVEEVPPGESVTEVEQVDKEEKESARQSTIEELQGKQEELKMEEEDLENKLNLVQEQVDELTRSEEGSEESAADVERSIDPDEEGQKLTPVNLQDKSLPNEDEQTLEDELEQESTTKDERLVSVEKISSTDEPAGTTTAKEESEAVSEFGSNQQNKPDEETQDELALEEQEMEEDRKTTEEIGQVASTEEEVQVNSADAELLENLSDDATTEEEQQVAKDFEKALELERKEESQAKASKTDSGPLANQESLSTEEEMQEKLEEEQKPTDSQSEVTVSVTKMTKKTGAHNLRELEEQVESKEQPGGQQSKRSESRDVELQRELDELVRK